MPDAFRPGRDVTFVLTSCGRFDLLAETMATFLAFNTAPIARYLVIEDSGDETVRGVVGGLGVEVDVIVNEARLGQMESIDRAYRTVETSYIFHCEDDWRFFRGGFVEESMIVLESDPAISLVNARRTGQNSAFDAVHRMAERRSAGGVAFRVPSTHASEIWGGYGFNPGLRRLSDYRRIGSFAARGYEKHASMWFKRQGMVAASLDEPAYETTGGGRHLVDPTMPESDYHPGRSRPPGEVAAPRSRNDACPCGSGERYKLCHGLPH